MESSEARLDGMEAQRSTDEQRKQRHFPMNLIKKRAHTLCSGGFNGEGTTAPKGETKSVSDLDFLTNLRLVDLYNLPGEYVSMNPEIFSEMRAGNREYLEKLKSLETPMACLKNNEGNSILHLAAAWGHLELVKGIISECPSLLFESNWKDQLPLHVAARAGHLATVEALVASVTFFSGRLAEEDRERLNPYVLKDKDGNTPLHLALKDLQEKTELLMYQKRIKFEQTLFDLITPRCGTIWFPDAFMALAKTAACLLNANQWASFLPNKDGISPLYLAVEAGNVALVRAMLNPHCNNVQGGQTSNLASRVQGRKSLVHAALKAKNTEMLDVILLEDPSLADELDKEGRTCLSVGASVGYYKGIRKLLDISTSNVYKCDNDGSFPIHAAVEKGHINVVKELLKRCPGSECLLNRQGQNILHIAAKSGKAGFLLRYKRIVDTVNHLIEEQDVDGNTPLHLATINWRCRTVYNITKFASTNTKILSIQNKDGLKALDIAEINLQSDYIMRERMTLMVLLCSYAPRGVDWMPTSGMTLKSRSENPDANKYKDHINALLLVATLVATVTFTAGLMLPGGFNSSAPNLGMAILANDSYLAIFLVLDTLAMQSSIIAIVALIWAQLGDPKLVHKAFHLALPSLCLALFCLSWAFIYGLAATIKRKSTLFHLINFLYCIFYGFLWLLLCPYFLPQVPGIPILQRWARLNLVILLNFVNENDDEKPYTSGSTHPCVKRIESVRFPGEDQEQK